MIQYTYNRIIKCIHVYYARKAGKLVDHFLREIAELTNALDSLAS